MQLEEFFDFASNEAYNRLAYTEEDTKYKIKVIEEMKRLGMTVTRDRAGNYCGTMAIGKNPQKTLVIGSHTDSVYNGGQYDGPVGVIAGLQVVENLKKQKKLNGIVKVAIYACEESSRFGNACIGSKYLNGNIKVGEFEKIQDQKALERGEIITLKDAIECETAYLKEKIKGIEEVDKIFDEQEIDYSLEAHIEQYQILDKKCRKENKLQIGIVNSIGSAVRVRYEVLGEAGHTGSTPMKKRKNAVDATCYIGRKVKKLGKQYEKEGLGRASQVEINTINHNGSFNQLSARAEGLIDFRLLGENTPETVLEHFRKIIKKAEKKTKTKINETIVSKGNPIITSQEMNEKIAKICDKEGVGYLDMPSYAGQDTGYIPAKQKTMIFIPSTGGSHNKEEKTEKRHIEASIMVLTQITQELIKEKFKDNYKCEAQQKVGKYEESSKEIPLQLKKEEEIGID